MMRMMFIALCQLAPNICSIYTTTHSENSVLSANNYDLPISDLSLRFYAPKLWCHGMILEEERHQMKLYQWAREWIITTKALCIQLLQFKGLRVNMRVWAKTHVNTLVLCQKHNESCCLSIVVHCHFLHCLFMYTL